MDAGKRMTKRFLPALAVWIIMMLFLAVDVSTVKAQEVGLPFSNMNLRPPIIGSGVDNDWSGYYLSDPTTRANSRITSIMWWQKKGDDWIGLGNSVFQKDKEYMLTIRIETTGNYSFQYKSTSFAPHFRGVMVPKICGEGDIPVYLSDRYIHCGFSGHKAGGGENRRCSISMDQADGR
ncbi:MAG: hypothetical protein K6E18_08095 [Lachnospiraceae bacterium]|nr:hypothetical protein [Lachnospiraceae bacterium]